MCTFRTNLLQHITSAEQSWRLCQITNCFMNTGPILWKRIPFLLFLIFVAGAVQLYIWIQYGLMFVLWLWNKRNVFVINLIYLHVILRLNAQVVEDGYEFFAKRQLVTLFSAPNYCGEFDNAGGMMSVDETLMCSFQVTTMQRSCFLDQH